MNGSAADGTPYCEVTTKLVEAPGVTPLGTITVMPVSFGAGLAAICADTPPISTEPFRNPEPVNSIRLPRAAPVTTLAFNFMLVIFGAG